MSPEGRVIVCQRSPEDARFWTGRSREVWQNA